MKQRLALVIEYDGANLHGWQRQANASSVQAHLEKALARIEGYPVACTAAGRTDTGVHADAQLVHVDVDEKRANTSIGAYSHGLNQLLPACIRVLTARVVRPDFHARFDCLERAYCYRIWNRSTASALYPWRHWWMPRPLDLLAMQSGADILLGEHDFSSFRASGCQASSGKRELRQIRIERQGCCVLIYVRADAFLYHMVRNIVGTLVEVGLGKREPEEMKVLLDAKDRRLAGATVPAQGLYFTDAVYPEFSSAELDGS